MIKIGVEVAILQGSEVSSNRCPANWITLWRSCSRPLIKDFYFIDRASIQVLTIDIT